MKRGRAVLRSTLSHASNAAQLFGTCGANAGDASELSEERSSDGGGYAWDSSKHCLGGWRGVLLGTHRVRGSVAGTAWSLTPSGQENDPPCRVGGVRAKEKRHPEVHDGNEQTLAHPKSFELHDGIEGREFVWHSARSLVQVYGDDRPRLRHPGSVPTGDPLETSVRARHGHGTTTVILGIETSCDETAAAIVTGGGTVLSSVVSSQADLHSRYGGVVPEVASRRHLELVGPVVREALGRAETSLDDVDRVAVTRGPGLVGALLVGVSAAKAIAWSRRLPLVPVDHLRGHVASLSLAEMPVEPPFVCLLASGGHTQLLAVREATTEPELLGTTLDDAAGEAFDKGARLLGLGYPGGAAIDRLARDGDAAAYSFPVAKVPGLDFSFSGLKTALLYAVRELGDEELERRRADLAASYQRAVVRALVNRIHEAAEQTGIERLAVVGGVAANSELRALLSDAAFAPLEYCTDNAAMIAAAARWLDPLPYPAYLDLDVYASHS